MSEVVQDEVYDSDGRGNTTLRTRTSRTVSDAEIERRDMPTFLRSRLPQLRAWSNDAQDVTALTAMTAGQRLARQAVIEARVAALAKIAYGLIWNAGQDDGS